LSEPVDGLRIGISPRPARAASIRDIVLEVFMHNDSKRETPIFNHRYNIYDYYPFSSFEVTRPDGKRFTLTKPPTYFDEHDHPTLIKLPAGHAWGVGFKLADWSATPEIAKPFSLPGDYQIRAIYQLNFPSSRRITWQGKLISPTAKFTLTAAKPADQGGAAGAASADKAAEDDKRIPFLPKAHEGILLVDYKVEVDGINAPAIFKKGTPIDLPIQVHGEPRLQKNGRVRVVVHTRSNEQDSWSRLTAFEIAPRNSNAIELPGNMRVMYKKDAPARPDTDQGAANAAPQAVPESSLWLPPYLSSATVESVTGRTFSYVPPYQGDKLRGFDASRQGIYFSREATPESSPVARLADAPLKLHRVLRNPYVGSVTGIELEAKSVKKIKVVGPPDSTRPLGEVVEHHELTRVTIIPGSLHGDATRGRMWITHSEDAQGGMRWVIHLRCTLRPALFPAEE
jgi:hypothetical protein